uniref:Exonuclease putative n=1 Tax=Albugo laibachii Nc14 TaxID=890382 RepID=F0WXD1_9STRA|nr:exonuclease putative [Albugo laibachii Nc14]|eukprot:CCA26123.1 exonuclease putative [Albugo laibachii Nc14]
MSAIESNLKSLVASHGQTGQILPLADLWASITSHILNTTTIRTTILLICEDVAFETSSLDISKPTCEMSNVQDTTEQSRNVILFCFPVRLSPNDSIPKCENAFLDLRASKEELTTLQRAARKVVKQRIKKFKKSHKVKGPSDKPSLEFYVMDELELNHNLRSILKEHEDPYIETALKRPDDNRDLKDLVFAVDCEMCKTTKGIELCRLTLIDSAETILLDDFVRPKSPIVDYCTQYSGFTPELMQSCSTRLEDIQKRFLDIVPAEAILIGHSIENDLCALRIIHRRIIDTVVLFPHPKGLPYRSSLRFLTAKFLHRVIQNDAQGHCSIEDAVATLQLVKLKVLHGPNFPSPVSHQAKKTLIRELCKSKKSVLVVDSKSACRSIACDTASGIPCERNDQIVSATVKQLTTGFPPHFTWARLGKSTLRETEVATTRILQSLPTEDSLLVVAFYPNRDELRDLHKLRTTRNNPKCSLSWDANQEQKLSVALEKCQQGFVRIYSARAA